MALIRSNLSSGGGGYTIEDYVSKMIQDNTADKKIYTASANVNIVANISMANMGEQVGGKVGLYNSSGTKLEDVFVKPYGAGGGDPTNVSFSMSSGDYLECYDMIAQTTTGAARISTSMFALT